MKDHGLRNLSSEVESRDRPDEGKRGDNRPPRPRFDSLAGRCLTAKNGKGPARGQKGREITGEQCREARERLNWTRVELATATNVPLWFIAAFEDSRSTPDFLVAYEIDLRGALESAGAEFGKS